MTIDAVFYVHHPDNDDVNESYAMPYVRALTRGGVRARSVTVINARTGLTSTYRDDEQLEDQQS